MGMYIKVQPSVAAQIPNGLVRVCSYGDGSTVIFSVTETSGKCQTANVWCSLASIQLIIDSLNNFLETR